MANYQTNHRDCQQWKADDLEMSTTSNEAVKLFDYALDQFLCHTPDLDMGGPFGAVKKMLECDEDFAMARVMFVGFNASSRINKEVAEEVAMLERIPDSKLNKRELLHRKAVIEWANEEQLNACKTWEEILLQYPKDTLALILSYYAYIRTGQSRMLRDCIARILPAWDKSHFHYGYLQGYYAFGLEETNMFDEAEKVVKESLHLIPNNSWAMHAYSHIFDSTCRSEEGVEFLDKNESLFNDNNSLTCHLYWHQTVNYTEIGEYEKVLQIYDQKIQPLLKKSGNFFNMCDGTQLLQRLEFEGCDVGSDRWNELYASYKPCVDQHESCYDDAHMLATFMRSKAAQEDNIKRQFDESFEEYLKSNIGSNNTIGREVFVPFANGISAYSEGRFEEAADHFIPAYKDIYRFGGSVAQRDFFHQFVINSCMRSPVPKHQRMAQMLLNERKMHRPNSTLTDRIMARLMTAH